MVVGVQTRFPKSLFIKVLKFRGAFPYPVIIKILTIFEERRYFL
jgi:hypothetical protein